MPSARSSISATSTTVQHCAAAPIVNQS
jgi:hypothetical protein